MTYSVITVTSLADTVSAMLSFASARGWAVANNGVTNPSTGNTFTLSSTSEKLSVVSTAEASFAADMFSPELNVAGALVLSEPITVHLFGNNAPYLAPDTEPFISAVIEYPNNYFRHVYIGTMVRAGNYLGGDVISANSFAPTAVFANITPFSTSLPRLFSGRNVTGVRNGGVFIDHPDNPVPYRKFQSADPGFSQTRVQKCTGVEVFGGNGDGVNDGYTHRSAVDHAGGQVLVPVALYCVAVDEGAGNRVTPLGHVSGVRLCSMENLVPTQQYAVLTDIWRCFPEFRRDIATASNWVSPAGRFVEETSTYLGIAHREA